MIYKELAVWVAQSASWQSFVDYKLDEKSHTDYPFLKRWEDFYIALIGNINGILSAEESVEKNQAILSIAKGLEIFSIMGKRERFTQIDYKANLLYTGALYFLAGYPASAYILCRSFKASDFDKMEDYFLFQILAKRINSDTETSNDYERIFASYLASGKDEILSNLITTIDKKAEESFLSGTYGYLSTQLISSLLHRFEQNNIWSALKRYNKKEFWEKFVEMNMKRPIPVWSFFPSQQDAIDKGLLLSPKSIALKMPTSSGKSSLSELAIYHEINSHPKAQILYLAPFRALASELRFSLRKHLAELGIKTKAIYGGHIPSAYERESIHDVDLLISTPEKFMAIENSLDESLHFSLVICDEGHLLDDQERGLRYELLLSRLKKKGGDNTRFLFISAIIPNIDQINLWLGGTKESVVDSDYRPTKLEFSLLKESRGSYTLDVNPESDFPDRYTLDNFITPSDFQYIKKTKKGDKQASVSATNKAVAIVAAAKSLNAGTVALFAPAKNGNTGVYSVAESFISMIELGLPLNNPVQYTKEDTINNLSEYFEFVFGTDYLLTKAVRFGFLFHHGDLPQSIREVIEDSIRKEEIKLVVCNRTLAEGVNLPIRTIVLSTTRLYSKTSNQMRFLKTRDIKNLVGRAGRAGKETKGSVIVVNQNDYAPVREIINNKGGEPVNGFLYTVVQAVNSYIRTRGIAVDQVTFDELDIIDAIDSSIIDLIAEDINPDELEQNINDLISGTLTYYLAENDNEVKNGLRELAQVRGKRIGKIMRENEFSFLKKSNSTLRLYENIFPRINISDAIWENVTSATDTEWLKYITGIVLEIPWIKKRAEESKLSQEQIVQAIQMWLNGKWYGEISTALKMTVEEALPLVNYFIGYHFQVNAASTIRAVALKRHEKELVTSPILIEWSNMLTHGVNSLVQLNLMDIGLGDRLIVQKVSLWMSENNITYTDSLSLKGIIAVYYDEIKTYLANNAPLISLSKFEDSAKYLKDNYSMN